MIRFLPVKFQARWWALRYPRSKIDAIKALRASAKMPLKDAKIALDPLYGDHPKVCPECGRRWL